MPPIPSSHKSSTQPPEENNLRLVAQAVINLNIARRNLLIYPLSHEQVKRSIAKAFKSVGQVAGSATGITLIVLKNGIGVGGRMLDVKSSALMDFGGILKQYQIATVTIKEDLEIKELARFLQLICMDRGKLLAKGGVGAVVDGLGFKSISIQTVDYSRLQLTEEQEIRRSSAQSDERGSVWQQFVSHFTTGHSSSEGQLDAGVDPGHLARILNQKELNVDHVVQHYQSTIAGVGKSGQGRQSLARELLAFQEMIKELDDGLKEQFLSVTFDHCGQLDSPSDTAYLIDGLGTDLIIQMLRQASSKGKKISPSLLSFIHKMGHADGAAEKEGMSAGEKDSSQGFTSQSVESLLAHEKYDTYVDSGYEKLLGKLGGEKSLAVQQESGQTFAQEIIGGLSGDNIHSHVAHAITRLMNHSAETSEYRDWARQLTYLLDDLLDHGAYGYLSQLMTFVRHETRDSDQERAEIADLVLDRFGDPQFVAKAIESVQTTVDETDPEALAFFMELGEPVVVEIFDGLDPSQTLSEQGILTRILKSLSYLATQEALERIKDPRPDYVRRMILIIRKMGDGSDVEKIRSLVDHEDIGVRMEALATLLEFKNKWGLVRLREMLGDPYSDAFGEAADLAGRYRIKAVAHQLEAIASQRGDIEPREIAIRALGKIGDPKVIPVLMKIARTRWSMAKSQTRHLKRVVYETLGGYQPAAVHHLLRLGLKQKDVEIREICENLLRRGWSGKDKTGEVVVRE